MTDGVYIGAINTAHKPICVLFLEAKKNIVCEMPIAINKTEAKEILDLAKEMGVFFMEVH